MLLRRQLCMNRWRAWLAAWRATAFERTGRVAAAEFAAAGWSRHRKQTAISKWRVAARELAATHAMLGEKTDLLRRNALRMWRLRKPMLAASAAERRRQRRRSLSRAFARLRHVLLVRAPLRLHAAFL